MSLDGGVLPRETNTSSFRLEMVEIYDLGAWDMTWPSLISLVLVGVRWDERSLGIGVWEVGVRDVGVREVGVRDVRDVRGDSDSITSGVHARNVFCFGE